MSTQPKNGMDTGSGGKFYRTPTGFIISENDYSFLPDCSKEQCIRYYGTPAPDSSNTDAPGFTFEQMQECWKLATSKEKYGAGYPTFKEFISSLPAPSQEIGEKDWGSRELLKTHLDKLIAEFNIPLEIATMTSHDAAGGSSTYINEYIVDQLIKYVSDNIKGRREEKTDTSNPDGMQFPNRWQND